MNALKIIGSRRPAGTPAEYLRVAATLRRRFLMLTPLSRPVSGIKKFRDWEAYEQWQADPNNSRQR